MLDFGSASFDENFEIPAVSSLREPRYRPDASHLKIQQYYMGKISEEKWHTARLTFELAIEYGSDHMGMVNGEISKDLNLHFS